MLCTDRQSKYAYEAIIPSELTFPQESILGLFLAALTWLTFSDRPSHRELQYALDSGT